MNEITKQRIAMMFNNTLSIIAFTVLAIVFNKWWIVLFSTLFIIYEKDVKENVNHDFCEWHKVKNGNAYKCNTHAEIYDSRVLDWFVCPYCGKKIKVVE